MVRRCGARRTKDRWTDGASCLLLRLKALSPQRRGTICTWRLLRIFLDHSSVMPKVHSPLAHCVLSRNPTSPSLLFLSTPIHTGTHLTQPARRTTEDTASTHPPIRTYLPTCPLKPDPHPVHASHPTSCILHPDYTFPPHHTCHSPTRPFADMQQQTTMTRQ